MRRLLALIFFVPLSCSVMTGAPQPTAPSPSPPPGLVLPGLKSGADIVYLDEDGDWQAARVRGTTAVAMPEGSVIGRVDRAQPFELARQSPVAAIPFIRSAAIEPAIGVELIESRSGKSIGTINLSSTPTHRLAATTSPGGESVYVARVLREGAERTVRVERYETGSGRLLGSVEQTGTFGSAPGWRPTSLGLRLVGLDADHYLLDFGPLDIGRSLGDFVVFDRELNVRAVVPGSPGGRQCFAELRRGPAGDWITVCTDMGLFLDSYVLFLDGSTFAEVSRLELPRELEAVMGWHLSPDGTLTLLTQRPLLVRVDARRREVIDRRPVTERRASWSPFGAQVAHAKVRIEPIVQFSPDGRFVYVAPWWRDAWWGPLALIDVTSATVVRKGLTDQIVRGIHVSPDGGRLYVLAAERGYTDPPARLLLLDPGSLAVAHTGAAIPAAFAIVGVLQRN